MIKLQIIVNIISMKKLLCVLFVVESLFCVGLNQKNFLDIIKLPKFSTYHMFVSSEVVPCLSGVTSVKNGNINIVSCPISQAKSLNTSIKDDVLGESISFDGDRQTFDDYIKSLNIKILHTQTFDDIYCVYAYKYGLKNSLNLSFGRVNLQLAFSKGVITVGNPIIIGSY